MSYSRIMTRDEVLEEMSYIADERYGSETDETISAEELLNAYLEEYLNGQYGIAWIDALDDGNFSVEFQDETEWTV